MLLILPALPRCSRCGLLSEPVLGTHGHPGPLSAPEPLVQARGWPPRSVPWAACKQPQRVWLGTNMSLAFEESLLLQHLNARSFEVL